MKKKKIQFIVLIVILAVCIIGYFLIKNTEFDKEEEVIETVITQFDADSVTALEVTGAYQYSFVKNGEEWTETSLSDEDIDENLVNNIIKNLCSLTTTENIAAEPEDLEPYGLAQPNFTAVLTFEDGTEQIIYFGERNSLLSKFYVQHQGDRNVYLINYSIGSAMVRSPEDFILEEETETAAE